MNRTRDWRRHQRERIRNRRRHYFTVAWAWEEGDLRYIGILSETPRPCSCDCCRNEWDRGMPPPAARAMEAEGHARREATIEDAALIDDWLRLAEDSFGFWNNDADANYDNGETQ